MVKILANGYIKTNYPDNKKCLYNLNQSIKNPPVTN
ncbi:hypothetical protein SAMN05444380_103113 [Thermophagus xiamenensis]|uniref:Uncharacterized protein n=1 Tax=Thermophagus xiamenensis TaxID=385682 RepID=A0A1I1VXR6_9BACT|nr:hypothetical protein SAMN05444380_103113 [Thermophagus xiamenensis]